MDQKIFLAKDILKLIAIDPDCSENSWKKKIFSLPNNKERIFFTSQITFYIAQKELRKETHTDSALRLWEMAGFSSSHRKSSAFFSLISTSVKSTDEFTKLITCAFFECDATHLLVGPESESDITKHIVLSLKEKGLFIMNPREYLKGELNEL